MVSINFPEAEARPGSFIFKRGYMANSTNSNIWEGQKVRLRAVEPGDWAVFHKWDRDTEAARLSYLIPFPRSSEGSKKWAAELASTEPKDDNFRFAIETLAGELVGTINTHSCDPRNGTFGYGIAVKSENRRQGYASEAIKLVLTYYFFELRYQKVTVHVYDFNEPSLKLHERLGFKQEGRLRHMGYTRGGYYDIFVFGLTREEFAELQAESQTN
jgi:RimJ/RimL family protein N-acetyltransferase